MRLCRQMKYPGESYPRSSENEGLEAALRCRPGAVASEAPADGPRGEGAVGFQHRARGAGTEPTRGEEAPPPHRPVPAARLLAWALAQRDLARAYAPGGDLERFAEVAALVAAPPWEED